MTVVSRQVNMELHKIKQKCPLYESDGNTVSPLTTFFATFLRLTLFKLRNEKTCLLHMRKTEGQT